jgi:hypothetical protein
MTGGGWSTTRGGWSTTGDGWSTTHGQARAVADTAQGMMPAAGRSAAPGMRGRTWAAPLPMLLLGVLTLIAGLASTARPVRAQSAEERAVVAVVERFFQGMLQRDTAAIRSTVDASARLVGAVTRNGVTTIRATPMDQFIASIGQRQGEGANERIHAPEVRIDGNLAQVWTFYTLHVGERFIHCGYDAFQLLRTEQGWKIVNVADTQRTERCEPPRS